MNYKSMREFEVLKQEIPGVRRDISLKNHTTFRIGGPAKYFFVAKTRKLSKNSVSSILEHTVAT